MREIRVAAATGGGFRAAQFAAANLAARFDQLDQAVKQQAVKQQAVRQQAVRQQSFGGAGRP